MTKLRDIKGRIDYISNKDRQENIVSYYTNAEEEDDFNRLAKEAQYNFQKYNKHDEGKCIEGRELIIALPYNLGYKIEDFKEYSKLLAEDFSSKYNVITACAIHSKTDKEGNIVNIHAHLIFSDREKLEEPIIQEEKIAKRTRYFDENWKRTTKSKAVHIQKKGDIIEKERKIFFKNKNQYFYTKEFKEDYEKHISEGLGLEKLDKKRFFATKHIGKNNPKKKYIEEYNKLVFRINDFFERLEKAPDRKEKKTPKQEFLSQWVNVEKLDIYNLRRCFFQFENFMECCYNIPEKSYNYSYLEETNEENLDFELEFDEDY